MDSDLTKTIGQDQQDRQDKAAFGRRHLAAGEQNPVNPVNPVLIKNTKTESIPHPYKDLKSPTKEYVPNEHKDMERIRNCCWYDDDSPGHMCPVNGRH